MMTSLNDNTTTALATNQTKKRLMDHAKLPYYLAQAFKDLYEEDGLVILGRGMGVLHLIASFCRFYVDMEEGHVPLLLDEIDHHITSMESRNINSNNRNTNYVNHLLQLKTRVQSHRPLIFVIGLRDSERSCLIHILERWGTPTEMIPTEVTNETCSSESRAELYARGGVFLITSRILIVDLLTEHANPQQIDGILVAHAEHVSEQSTIAFILRIYRTQRRFSNHNNNLIPTTASNADTNNSDDTLMIQKYLDGFVKAFSNDPDKLTSGFAKVDKILKSLFVRRLYIYPRFHEEVKQELERCPPIVEEFRLTLTQKMIFCQAAIAAAVKACIREIKKNVTFIDWNDVNNNNNSNTNSNNYNDNNNANDLTLENCVTTKFDIKIIKQLEQDWHRLKPVTKRLVDDLRSLRRLFHYLLELDCINFWKVINNLKRVGAASRCPSMWLLSESGNALFRVAKERMYTIVEGSKPTKKNPNPVKMLIPTLEENPKWSLLHQILSEIETNYRKKKCCDCNNNKVLVMVKDNSTLNIVRDYLVDGKETFMKKRFLTKYLTDVNDRTRTLWKGGGGKKDFNLSEESRLLMEEESKTRYYLKQQRRGVISAITNDNITLKRKNATTSLNAIPDWKRKRRKVLEEKNRGSKLMQSAEDRERIAMINEAFEEVEHYDSEEISSSVTNTNLECDKKQSRNSHEHTIGEDELFDSEEMNNFRVVFQTYTSTEGEEAYLLLNDINPDHIVLYDTEPSFLRSIEIYAAQKHYNYSEDQDNDETSGQNRIKVYFMQYGESSEEKNFIRSLEREQYAFERLIQHKKTMALPVNMLGAWTTQEMQLAASGTNNIGSYVSGTLPLSIDTRTGRGKKINTEKRDIAVDIREFRSVLPSVLHQGGMRIAPVTLTVGDYVLSTVHCVERKGLNDLKQSLTSDKPRLFTQAAIMCKHYKVPCLLIEFDPNNYKDSFCLQNTNEIGPDVKKESICARMAVLLMHSPRLRILWSRSPHETLKIFKLLKCNHEEVDVENAKEIGSNESIDAITQGSDINEVGLNMLKELPGINKDNVRKVMNECDSIAELASLTREEMKRILGPLGGQKLFTFFHQKG